MGRTAAPAPRAPATTRGDRSPASHTVAPRPAPAAGYGGTITARRDAMLDGTLAATIDRAVAAPRLPAYLATPAGRIRPRADTARADTEPTPAGRLPPLRGLAGTPTARVAETDGRDHPAEVDAVAPPDAAAAPVADGAAPPTDATETGSGPPEGTVPADAGRAAPDGAGSGGAGAASPGRNRRARSPSEDVEPLRPLPEVDRGTVTLSRPGIAVATDAPGFEAPRTLAVAATKPADKLDPDVVRYREVYGQAAAAAEALYARIVGGLGRLVSAATASADRASSLRQRDLDEGLRGLDVGLATSRLDLRIALRDDLVRLDGAALGARHRINRAAGNGVGRLRARARRIETDLRGKRGESAAIEAMPTQKIAQLNASRAATGAALTNLASHATTLLPQPENQDGARMKAAEFEAMIRDIAFPVREAGLEMDESVERMRTGLQAQVDPTARSICMSFCPFEGMKTMLANEGEQAVGRARAQSIEQLEINHRRVRRQLERSLQDGERTIILQHRTQRRRLVDAASDRQRVEQGQHQQQARTAAAMYAAAAGAQPAALKAIHDRIAGTAARGEAVLANATTEFSRGLIANGVPRGRVQLTAIEARVEGAAASLRKVGQQASQRFAEGAKGAVGAFRDDARRSDDAAAGQVRQAEAALMALAKPITETVDGFIRSVNQNFATAMTGLDTSLNQIRQGLIDNFAGNPPPTAETPTPGVTPAADCTSCPPAPPPAEHQEGGTGEAPESVNAFIARIDGYQQAPATERNVASYCTTVPRLIRDDMRSRSRALGRLLCYTDSAPYSVLDQLRGVTALQGSAIEETYNAGGKDLRADLDWYLNAGNPVSGVTTRVEAIRAARDYLNGNVASGARHELNVCVNWSNDSAQIDKVMKSLTPEQMGEMFDSYPNELRDVRNDLNALDIRVFDALRHHDVGLAIALRGQAAIDTGREARGYTGIDRAGDEINRMYNESATSRLSGGPALSAIEGSRTHAARVAEEWSQIQSSFASIVGPEFNRPAEGGEGPPQAGDALINYAARGITYEVDVPNDVGEGTHSETRTDTANEAQRRLLTALVRHHAGSPEARSARLALELGRPGGADPARVREATYDEALNPALVVEGAPGGIEAARRRHDAAVENQRRTYELLAEHALGDAAGPPLSPAMMRTELARRLGEALAHDPDRANHVRSLVLADPSNPEEFVNQTVTQLEFAMDGAGTNVDAMRRALSSLTREQYRAVKAQWAETHHGEDLDIRIGIPGHGNWFERLVTSETSGDTALEMERLRYGIATTEQQQAELAALEIYQQIREAGEMGPIVAGAEFAQLNADYRTLMSGMGASGMRIGRDGELEFLDAAGAPAPLGHFDAAGRFQAQPGFTAEDLALAMTVGRESAAAYVAATDRIADMIATALVVTAAIVTTALTGGAAASIWIPVLVTAAAGIASMGVKWAIKGGRYGSEEMLFDLASTIVMAATAGIGAAAGAALRGGGKAVGALARSWRMSEMALAEAAAGGVAASRTLPALTLGQELFVGALTAGIGGGANAAIAPDSWRSDNYARDILAGIMRGALGGAIGAGVARGVGKLAGPLGEIPSRGLASGASGAASRMGEMAFDDRVLGRHVTWSEFTEQASTAFLQNFVQGMGEGMADAHMRNRSASRRAEHDWAQAHNHEEMLAHETAARKAAEAELARRGVAANDNPPPVTAIPEIDPAAPPPTRAEVPDPAGHVTVPARALAEGEPIPTGRSALTDDPGMLGPALHPDGTPVEPPARLRSARGGFDDDEKTNPGIPIDHPTFPNGVDLRPGDLDHLPPIMADTIVRGTNPHDGAQARMNYEVMRSRLPGQEVLLAYHLGTGEYYVMQGLPHSVLAPPEGYITLRHTHPEVMGGDAADHFLSVLPSGIGGDCTVLARELDRMPGASTGMTVGRSSVIDITVNGTRVATTFEITRTGNNYALSVTLDPAVHGVASMGPFRGSREEALLQYAIAARDHTDMRSDFGQSRRPDDPVVLAERGDNTSRVVRNATPSEVERHDAAFVAQRMAQREAFDQQARGLAARGEIDPHLGRIATTNDAHERVRAMGLVGEPDSLARLTRLLNASDPDFTPEMRSALARATLEATRAEMIRTGALAPGDELLMLFRGVTGARTDDYEREGINLAHLGPGKDEDASRGLYGSQDFESALRYAGSDGQGAVLPLIVRQSELGNVIDVRSGTPLGDRWLAFLRTRTDAHSSFKRGYDHLVGQLSAHFPISHDRDGRGTRYEAFLAELAADPTLPDAIRSAARDPHITLMDLGGAASTGNDRGILTDQFAMHHQRIADLFNEAHDFPVPGREGGATGGTESETPLMFRSEVGNQTPKPPTPPVATTTVPSVDPVATSAAVASVRDRFRQRGERWALVAENVLAADHDGAVAVLQAHDDAARHAALEDFRLRVIAAGHSPEIAERMMRQMDFVATQGAAAFQRALDHELSRATMAAMPQNWSAQMRQWVSDSPILLHYLGADQSRLRELYLAYTKLNSLAPHDMMGFERYAINRTPVATNPVLGPQLRSLRTTMLTENRALAARLLRKTPQGATYRPAAPDPEAGPRALPRAVQQGSDLQPGARIDHPTLGRGTVVEVNGDAAHIAFDATPGQPELAIPIVGANIVHATEPDSRFGDAPHFRQKTEIESRLDDIARFREQAGLPVVKKDATTGTAAAVLLGGEVFHGTNSGLDPPSYSALLETRHALFARLVSEFGLKVTDNAFQNAQFLGHAEAEAMLLAYAHFGRLPEVLEIYADRTTCNDCSTNLILLARMLGVRELRVYYRNQTDPPLIRR